MTAPRNEVLTKEEAEDVKQRRFSAAHGSLAEPIEVDALVAIIDRLVSRIESDAARSAALRKVAEAAGPVAAEHREMTKAADADGWYCETCKIAVPGVSVTFSEHHDARSGGCGNSVTSVGSDGHHADCRPCALDAALAELEKC